METLLPLFALKCRDDIFSGRGNMSQGYSIHLYLCIYVMSRIVHHSLSTVIVCVMSDLLLFPYSSLYIHAIIIIHSSYYTNANTCMPGLFPFLTFPQFHSTHAHSYFESHQGWFMPDRLDLLFLFPI
jgi:hypothetical protein